MYSLTKGSKGSSVIRLFIRHLMHRSVPTCPCCGNHEFRRIASKACRTFVLDTHLCRACTHVEQFVRKPA
jgi:hypothetical protein